MTNGSCVSRELAVGPKKTEGLGATVLRSLGQPSQRGIERESVCVPGWRVVPSTDTLFLRGGWEAKNDGTAPLHLHHHPDTLLRPITPIRPSVNLA